MPYKGRWGLEEGILAGSHGLARALQGNLFSLGVMFFRLQWPFSLVKPSIRDQVQTEILTRKCGVGGGGQYLILSFTR